MMRVAKNKNCCSLHEFGHYRKWSCMSVKDAKKRQKNYRDSFKKECSKCGASISKSSTTCHPCYSKTLIGKSGYSWSEVEKEKIKERQLGEHNSYWKGEKAGYGALHAWVNKLLLKETCLHCGSNGKLDTANKSGKYLRIISDWIILCRSCHKKYDQKIEHKRFKSVNKRMILSTI